MQPRLLLLIAVVFTPLLHGQQLQQASYTDSQAQSGESLYIQSCAACHLPDLTGSFEAPALNDANFQGNWTNRNVSELVDLLRQTMPPQAPASLTEQQYIDITAYLLSANDIASGSTDLITAANAVVFIGDNNDEQVPLVQRIPVPGRAGTIPTPGPRDSVPDIATVYQSERGITRSYVAIEGFKNVTTEELANPAPADWTYWRRTPQSQGYSPLNQINKENVAQLSLAWVWGMEPGRSQPGPLVRDGNIYIPNFGNVIQSINGRDGTLLWEYQR